MSTIVRPTQSGGRLLAGNTPHGDYTITLHRDHDGPVYDAAGNELGHVRLTIKTPPLPPPPVLTDDQRDRVGSRLAVCEGCEHFRGAGRVTVRCDRCRTCRNAKDLLAEASSCPIGKW